MVDVGTSDPLADFAGSGAAAPAGEPGAGMAPAERAAYEREIAVLDLSDGAQAAACADLVCDGDGREGRALIERAATLYESADRHRHTAERLEAVAGDATRVGIHR